MKIIEYFKSYEQNSLFTHFVPSNSSSTPAFPAPPCVCFHQSNCSSPVTETAPKTADLPDEWRFSISSVTCGSRSSWRLMAQSPRRLEDDFLGKWRARNQATPLKQRRVATEQREASLCDSLISLRSALIAVRLSGRRCPVGVPSVKVRATFTSSPGASPFPHARFQSLTFFHATMSRSPATSSGVNSGGDDCIFSGDELAIFFGNTSAAATS